jgi:hypothetical protein
MDIANSVKTTAFEVLLFSADPVSIIRILLDGHFILMRLNPEQAKSYLKHSVKYCIMKEICNDVKLCTQF